MRIPCIAQGLGHARWDPRCGVSRIARAACVLAVLSLIVPWSQGFAQSRSLKKSPAEIVKNYVRLDKKGARLHSVSFEALVPYIDWKNEPTWNRVVVIHDADVPEDYRKWDIINNMEVVIPVTYQVRGSIQLETATFVPDERTEEVRFRVKAVGNNWRIVDPVIPPHIGLKRMVNFVREAQIQEVDAAQRAVLAMLVDSLRRVK